MKTTKHHLTNWKKTKVIETSYIHVGWDRDTGHQERFYKSITRRECSFNFFVKFFFPRLRGIRK